MMMVLAIGALLPVELPLRTHQGPWPIQSCMSKGHSVLEKNISVDHKKERTSPPWRCFLAVGLVLTCAVRRVDGSSTSGMHASNHSSRPIWQSSSKPQSPLSPSIHLSIHPSTYVRFSSRSLRIHDKRTHVLHGANSRIHTSWKCMFQSKEVSGRQDRLGLEAGRFIIPVPRIRNTTAEKTWWTGSFSAW